MPIDLTRGWNSPRFGRDLCGLLTALDEPDPVSFMKTRFLPLIPADAATFVRAATGNAPLVVDVVVNGVHIVLLQGVKAAGTALALFNAYASPVSRVLLPTYNQGINRQVQLARDEIWDWQASRPSSTQWDRNTIFCGHSFGGAVAQSLAHRGTFDWGVGPDSGCVSFGSPRVGTHIWVGNASNYPNVRWYNVDDPIRHMPPHATEAPLAHGLMPRNTSIQYNLFVHGGDGYALQRTGQFDRVNDVPPTPPIADRNLVTWATGINDANVVAHNIREYFTRMQAAVDLFNFQFPMAPSGFPTDRNPPTGTPVERVPAVQVALDAALVTTRQQVQALNAVRQPAYFRAIRRNRHYMVVDRDRNTVVLAASRVRARNISSRANELYREAVANGETDLTGIYFQVSQMI